jgi:hypothetical protein
MGGGLLHPDPAPHSAHSAFLIKSPYPFRYQCDSAFPKNPVPYFMAEVGNGYGR